MERDVKVGDMVVRAYAWDGFISGIIVEEDTEMIQLDDNIMTYDSITFTVAWSDGTMSSEMYEELDYYVKESRFEDGGSGKGMVS
jgi:hypothetical protein